MEMKDSCQRVLFQVSEDMGDGEALMPRHGARYAVSVDRKHFSTDMVHAKLRQLLHHLTGKDASTGSGMSQRVSGYLGIYAVALPSTCPFVQPHTPLHKALHLTTKGLDKAW